MKFIIIQTTCSSETQAKEIARTLVEKSLAACVHFSKIESFYMWQNEFCNDDEILLNIKTKKKNFKKIEDTIKQLHSYDVPEIISIEIDKMSKGYEKFIKSI